LSKMACDCSDILAAAIQVVEEMQLKSPTESICTNERKINSASDQHHDNLEFYFKAALIMLLLQSFVLVYSWMWMHFPLLLNHQVQFMCDTVERITRVFASNPKLLDGVVKMTEETVSNPQNIEAMSKAMHRILTSKGLINGLRAMSKELLSDTEFQSMLGTSLSSISKEAVRTTFSWPNSGDNKNQNNNKNSDNNNDTSVSTVPHHDHNPIGQWFEGLKHALDKRLTNEFDDKDIKDQNGDAIPNNNNNIGGGGGSYSKDGGNMVEESTTHHVYGYDNDHYPHEREENPNHSYHQSNSMIRTIHSDSVISTNEDSTNSGLDSYDEFDLRVNSSHSSHSSYQSDGSDYRNEINDLIKPMRKVRPRPPVRPERTRKVKPISTSLPLSF